MKQIDVQEWYNTFPKDINETDITYFFEYAVKELKENFMFMGIRDDEDDIPHMHFKHRDTKKYIKFPMSFNDAFLNYPNSFSNYY